MSGIIYKKLCEVRLLHEYYLTLDNTSFFSNALTGPQKEERLAKVFRTGIMDLRRDLLFEPTEATKMALKQHRIIFKTNGLGFTLFLEVTQDSNSEFSQIYYPKIPIEDTLLLAIHLKTINRYFRNFSNLALDDSLPSIYYFDNRNANNTKSFPSLSHPAAAYLVNTVYEMGALAMVNDTLQEAIQRTDNPETANWQIVEGEGFINDQDKYLLPKQFLYRVPTTPGISQINLTLADLEGNVVKNVSLSNLSPGKKVAIDFTQNDAKEELIDNFYDLQLTADNGLDQKKRIHLSDALFDQGALGVINLSFDVSDPDFRLLEADGGLRTRIENNGTLIPYPIFELRLRSRTTYWRYVAAEAFDALTIASTAAYLDVFDSPDNKILVAKNPKALSLSSTSFGSGNSSLMLPNPPVDSIKFEPTGRLYSDIHISAVNRLLGT